MLVGPGGPVVKTLHFQCRGHGFDPWSGNFGKESACQCRTHRFNPGIGMIPWKRTWQPTPVFLPWTEEHGGLQSMGLKKSQT